MPDISRVYIRSSLLCLAFGFILGGLIQANNAVFLSPVFWMMKGLHAHLLLYGWFAQVAMGVAFWCLPRLPGGYRGKPWANWTALILYQIGLATLAAHNILAAHQVQIPHVTAVAVACLAAGIGLFIINMWPRLREIIC